MSIRLVITGEDVRKIRGIYRMTPTQLASALNYSQTYITMIESKVEPVTDRFKARLCSYFELDTAKLAEIRADYNKYTIK